MFYIDFRDFLFRTLRPAEFGNLGKLEQVNIGRICASNRLQRLIYR